jgi:hypothetical protein
MVQENDVPNINVQEYNSRANSIFYQRLQPLFQMQLPNEQLPQEIERLKE